MKFVPQDEPNQEEYTLLRVPAAVVDTEHSMNLEFVVRVDESTPGNSLVFIGRSQVCVN